MFDSRSFDTRSFDARSWDFRIQVTVTETPSGGFEYATELFRYNKKTPEQIREERIKLGIFTADEIERAESLVSEAIESRKGKQAKTDVEGELRAAEAAFRAYLDELKKEWTREYILLLAASYAKIEQENVDAQIVMLLWDM